MDAAPLELSTLFEDVLTVARSVRSSASATTTWRAMCVRARRTLGTPVVGPLSDLDLDADVDALAPIVRRLTASVPKVIDTLVFELFEPMEGAGAFAGFRLAGTEGFDPASRWLPRAPEWQPSGAHLPSRVLDAIVAAERAARRAQKPAVGHALRFGAAALLARGLTRDLVPGRRVVVAFEGGEAYEVVPPALELRSEGTEAIS